MRPGRNDPCPCGSGKKYKRCHGNTDSHAVGTPSVEATRADVLKACDVRLSERLIRFARRHYGANWLVDVLDEVGLLDENNDVPEAEMSLVIPWLRHCLRDDDGLTLADVWRRFEQPRLTPEESLVLAAYDTAWLSVWEVAEVDRGVGSRVIDLLTREERYIHDVSSSLALQRNDSVLGIVLTFETISFFGGVHAQPLPPRFADTVVREARRMCHVRTRPVAPAKVRDPALQLELMALWSVVVEDMVLQPPPVLQNTDGDPVVQTRDDFALLTHRDDVAARLATLEGVIAPAGEEEDGLVFVVAKSGNAMHRSWDNTVIARVVLAKTHLRLETNSTRRADSLRASVEEHLKGMVRFRLRSEEDIAKMLASPRPAAARERDMDSPPPEMLAAMRAFREQHMRDWLDEAVPALGGLTPRKAATTTHGRRQLAVLLKEFEQSEDRLPADQRIDLGWLRETLGNP